MCFLSLSGFEHHPIPGHCIKLTYLGALNFIKCLLFSDVTDLSEIIIIIIIIIIITYLVTHSLTH